MGEFVFHMGGASFLSGGCAPWGGISFDGEGFKKIIEWGGAPPPAPHAPPTMGNPAAG